MGLVALNRVCVDGTDHTPETVTTTRAPAVFKTDQAIPD